MTDKHIKFAVALIFKMQIKIIMRYHYYILDLLKLKKKMTIPNFGEDVKQLEFS